MVIAAVDDLLFSSRIRTVAKQVGVEVFFARSPDAILRELRERKPPLLIVDLNGERMAPLDSIRAVAGDPDLAGTRIVAFVSHVQTGTILAAREAGAHAVMARSAFAASLADVLASAK
jgi:DNA-binding NarL/FixJ family response regulator